MNKDLFIKSIIIEKDRIANNKIYPFNIKCINNLERIDFNKNVTFFVGENGVGKSTLIEAIAISLGLNPEGGTQNFNFSTLDTHSILHEYMHVLLGDNPKTKYFLRAESFYNVASEIKNLYRGESDKLTSSYGGDLHNCSHGESFIQLIQNRFTGRGLYILDEPEAALSPNRQMSLLCLIDDLVKKGSQFIIATHSPILISYRDGEILNLNNNFEKVNYEDTDIYQTYKMYLENPWGIQHQMFDIEEL